MDLIKHVPNNNAGHEVPLCLFSLITHGFSRGFVTIKTWWIGIRTTSAEGRVGAEIFSCDSRFKQGEVDQEGDYARGGEHGQQSNGQPGLMERYPLTFGKDLTTERWNCYTSTDLYSALTRR